MKRIALLTALMTLTLLLVMALGSAIADPSKAARGSVSTPASTDEQSSPPVYDWPLRSFEGPMTLLLGSSALSPSNSENAEEDGIGADPLTGLVSILVFISLLLSGSFLLAPYELPKLASGYASPLQRPG